MILDLSSCAGRCGEGYSRDAICNCDYNCQHYMECCPDFKKECTVGKSWELVSPLSSSCPVRVPLHPLQCCCQTVSRLCAEAPFSLPLRKCVCCAVCCCAWGWRQSCDHSGRVRGTWKPVTCTRLLTTAKYHLLF